MARGERLHDQVRVLGETPEQGLTVGVPQVECHASLAGVHVQEEQASIRVRLVVPERRDVAGRIAAGALDLDDVGTHVGEQLAAVDTFLVGELEHPPAAQCAVVP